MHSLLGTNFHAKNGWKVSKWAPAILESRRKSRSDNIINIIFVFLLVAGAINLLLNGDFSRPQENLGPVRSGADTMSLVDSPYIYPDLSLLSEYRTSQRMTLMDGSTVSSKKHSYSFHPTAGADSPSIVLVVGLDSDMSQTYLQKVLDNRLSYAQEHGYGLYARYLKDFYKEYEPESTLQFAKVSLMREAMFTFKDCKWLWWLDQDAIIMRPEFDLDSDLLDHESLDQYMIRNLPIPPKGSSVHSYKRVQADQIKFIACQNDRGISTSSFIVSNDGIFGHVVFDYWMDPLHRSYNGFQNFKGHNGYVDASLTHMVQWHPVILSRMALITCNLLGSTPDEGLVMWNQKYHDGDFIYLLHSANSEYALGGKELEERWAAVQS